VAGKAAGPAERIVVDRCRCREGRCGT
jgi:hypothetical protein